MHEHAVSPAEPARASVSPVQTLRRSAEHDLVDDLDGHCACGGHCAACAGGLPIGPPDDVYEREADAAAERVLAGNEAGPLLGAAPAVRRACACGGGGGGEHEGEEECADCRAAATVMRAAAGPAPGAVAPASVEHVTAAPGRALDAPLRASMEQAFGHDLSHVRVHTDPAAARSAAAVNAHAYAVGPHVVFGAGRYAPETRDGRRLLAHELAHVVQARSGPVVQRQDIGDLPDVDQPRARPPPAAGAPPQVAVVDPNEPAHCPPVPTNLGNLVPVPPCRTSDEDEPGSVFAFCTDSDVFRDPGDRDRLRQFAGSQDAPTRFVVHAYASKEGPGTSAAAHDYNVNLACHRGQRVARELLNAGVHEERIEVFSNGPTERFGAGDREPDLARNRVVELSTSATRRQTVTLEPRATAREVADAARDRIVRGEYALAADGYVARWTCGRFRSLADVVARTTVLIEGEPGAPVSVVPLGQPSLSGLNTIILPRSITVTDDPVECAANRIADLAFHHVSRPQLPSVNDQHEGALHMLSLGGFQACSEFLTHRAFALPRATDPKQGQQPACADQPLPGAIAPQHGPASPSASATFTVTSLDVASAAGAATQAGGMPFIGTESPPGAMSARAEIVAAGDPHAIAAFRVGFVQTVLAEDNVASYVGGQRVRWRLPLPLRDGPQRGDPMSDPPWFDRRSRVDAAPGTLQVQLEDFPDIRMLSAFPDLAATAFAESRDVPLPGGGTEKQERPGFAPSLNLRNPVDRGRRRIRFDTWVVARRERPPAPADHGSTEFLAGRIIVFTIDADVSGQIGAQRATGSWRVQSAPAAAADAASVQLRGATPADFISPTGVPLFNEFLVSEGAPARGQDPRGQSHQGLRTAVEAIAAPSRRALGLTRRLRVRLSFDLATGRLILDSPRLDRGAVRVEAADGDPPLDAASAAALAREIFPDVRKLVLGDDPFVHSTSGTFSMPLILNPLQP